MRRVPSVALPAACFLPADRPAGTAGKSTMRSILRWLSQRWRTTTPVLTLWHGTNGEYWGVIRSPDGHLTFSPVYAHPLAALDWSLDVMESIEWGGEW